VRRRSIDREWPVGVTTMALFLGGITNYRLGWAQPAIGFAIKVPILPDSFKWVGERTGFVGRD
jgi:membrane protein YqaA with SNARE-associated domain